MQFEVLGPLRVNANTGEVSISSGRERTLLAVLLLHANRTVPNDQLVEAIWAEQPPPSARNQLQGCVSRLRRRLATTGLVIVTEPGGYRATVAPDDLDLLEFRRLVAEARSTTAAGDHVASVAGYRTALDLWRGPALGGIDTGRTHAAVALDEEHVQVQEECIEAQLAAGGAGRLVPELTELVGQHPHRERLHRALMLALYRAGRQADALAAYRHARTILHDELGIEPGAELQRLHQAILNRGPDLDAPPTPARPASSDQPPIPRELPADVTGFTGRADALTILDELIDGEQADGPPAPVVISAIAGTAGVGKTTLAVHWAHQVADRFPDGQLYLNLRGYATTTPVRPIEALSALLRSLGTPPEQIPTDETQAAALYRTKLAGRRALVLLDNARSVDQIRPLLPGAPGCLVLVTSRDRLTGLIARDGATRLTLDVLTPHEAQTLLSNLLGSDRTKAEPAAINELARACAYLPLALRIAAELAAARATAPLADLVAELSDRQLRLDLLDGDGDPLSTVKVVFSWSIQHLPQEAARMFGWLGLLPGPDFDAYAAAALADLSLDQASQALELLAQAHLVHSTRPGRYGMHDLLRAYATDQTTTEYSGDERRAVLSRLFDYYLATAATAMNTWYPAEAGRRPPVPAITTPTPTLADLDAARSWLDSERRCLAAMAGYTAAHGWRAHTIRLSGTLYRYFEAGHYIDGLTIHGYACSAAEQAGEVAVLANVLRYLGTAHMRISQYDTAVDYFRKARTMSRRAADPISEAMALTNLGISEWTRGSNEYAAECHQQALALFRKVGDNLGSANALNNVGVVEQRLGRYESAAAHHRQAADLFQQLGDQRGEASALNNLGWLDGVRGRYESADLHLRRALALVRSLRSHHGQAVVLDSLGILRVKLGQPEQALDHLVQALVLYREAGEQDGQATALNGLGEATHAVGRPDDALTYHTDALVLADYAEAREQQARAHAGIGKALYTLDDPDRARTHYERALAIYSDLDMPEADEIRAHLENSLQPTTGAARSTQLS